MFGFFSRKDTQKKEKGQSSSAPRYRPSKVDYNIATYVPELKKIVSAINVEHLSSAEQQFIETIKSLPNNLNGVHAAYHYLNDFILQQSTEGAHTAKEKEAGFFSELTSIHERMLKDPALNWYGVPKPDELQRSTNIYNGEAKFNQRMEHFLTNAADKLVRGKQELSPESNALRHKLDGDFLERYVKGELNSNELIMLDSLEEDLKKKEMDFLTTQTAFHLYRYLIAKKENSANASDYIFSRGGKSPFATEFPRMDLIEFVERVEKFLPEDDLKAFYEESKKSRRFLDPSNEFKGNLNFGAFPRGVTPLKHHYEKFMNAILEQTGQEKINRTIEGQLPAYDSKGGKQQTATLSRVIYPDTDIHEAKIENATIDRMLTADPKSEAYVGQRLQQHLSRLYTIALLTDDPKVREEARARFEWWYSNIMPYARGSAAASEGLSKMILLSHNIGPKQMKGDILPDLGAIAQYSEDQFIIHHDDFYQGHPNQLAFPTGTPTPKPRPSTPLGPLDDSTPKHRSGV